MSDDGWTADTQVRRQGVEVAVLAGSLAVLIERHPNARLVRNQVGNLNIYAENGQWLGWIDVTFGNLELLEQELPA